MMKFFRRFRQNLLSEGKTVKYFKYALGEILLVVAGILIALQINTWNEANKNRAYELKMLQEVKEALEVDAAVLEDVLPYLEATMYSIHQLAVIKADPTHPTDSLYFHLQQTMSFGTNLSFNQSPYKTLESGGLDRISNPQIRNELSKLYGFSMSNATLWVNEVLRLELFKKKDLFAQIFGLQVTADTDNIISTQVRLNNPAIIYNNPDFDMLLSTAGWALPNTYEQIRVLHEQMMGLIQQIDFELKNEWPWCKRVGGVHRT